MPPRASLPEPDPRRGAGPPGPRGFTGLWLIGLWERSRASQRIKQMMGNPDAVASAYSLYDYQIADDLGGEDAYRDLRERAWQRGIRLASDMVPNHMGIDSRWVIEHPDWFVQLPHSPFPAYTFTGPDLSDDERVGIYLEDHYYEPHRRGGGLQARRPRHRRGALHLPRQRRHQHALERHRPARLPASPRCARR
jgi:hypothetical protein